MRRIRKCAVLGSGIMGSGIACHLANIGLEVLMLDMVPRDLPEDKKDNKAARNSLATAALKASIKSKPAPLYDKAFASRITLGNFTDDMPKIKDCDWIIEVVVERLDIKKIIFEQVDKFRSKGSLVTSNTSGIPIRFMSEGRSADFQKHFCGTHFFNPPRYLRLFEVIPGPKTSKTVINFFMNYGRNFLGKDSVLAKDTPAFIGNRIGVYAMSKVYKLTEELGLKIGTVDKITGPAMGRPNTGTFRLGDLVGLDTAIKVSKGIIENAPDEQSAVFEESPYMTFLNENKFYGNKSGQGFYKKTKERDERGKSVILALNLETNEYEKQERESLPSLGNAKQIEELDRRIRMFFKAEDKGGQLVRRSLAGVFAYASNRLPEVADQLFSVDDAIRAGFAWEAGPFEYWDMVGLDEGLKAIKEEGLEPAAWVTEMKAAGHKSFYIREKGQLKYYDREKKAYVTVPGTKQNIHLDNYREKTPVFQNSEAVLHDIGNGVLCLEFRSKANSMGEGVLKGIQEAITIAEEGKWAGLVIGNSAKNFTVGANLMLIAQFAFQQEWDELNFAVDQFQKTMMRCRYSSIPVVAATQGYTFGGGCETIMHCDASMSAAESYIGLVEVGVGLIPGGGGTKEFALRASDSFFPGDVQIPTLIDKFKTIAMASVATSAHEAFNMGYLLKSKDEVVINTKSNIAEAKKKVLELTDAYTQPVERQDITVLGRTGLGALYAAANELKRGHYASEHDIKIAKKVAYVLCGGDLTGTQKVSEQYLLDIEREAFISLAGEQKTMERIQHMLTKNKPLRN